MATGSVLLPVRAWVLPDGTANNLGPAPAVIKGTQTNAVFREVLSFGTNTLEQVYCTFPMPEEYASGGSLLIDGTVNSTTAGNSFIQAAVSATTAGDTDTFLEHAFSTAAGVAIAVNATEARREAQGTITLNMDSAANTDSITIRLFRDKAHASDTNDAANFEFAWAKFIFTTT